MSQIGEIQRAVGLGFQGSKKYIFHACITCGKGRWVQLCRGIPRRLHCQKCASLKGIPIGEGQGYVMVKLKEGDFFCPTANKRRYVLEHRLTMAKYLGRNLHRWEIVHHINGVRDDNQIGNLQLVSDHRHKQITILENRIGYLERLLTKNNITF